MQLEPRHIIKSMFGREDLMDVAKEEARRLAEEFPYSPVAQYLLTRRLQASSDPGYGDSVTRTAIYFHNPHWLSQLLRRQTSEERTNALEESLGLTEPASETLAESVALTSEEIELAPIETDEDSLVETVEPEEAADTVARTGTGESDNDDDATPDIQHAQPEAEAEASATGQPNETMEPGESDNDDDATPDIQHAEAQAEATATGQPTETIEPGESDNDDDTSSRGEPAYTVSSSEPIPDFTAEAPSAALQESEPLVPFEPVFATDYFASQGVQLEEREKTDRLGMQMRSFTQWLRSMKPIRQEATARETAVETKQEEKVRHMAEESNSEEEVLTEAMADVYAKQGLRLRAIDIYRKLSLLHPDKSSTFAAKIDQLKGISP